MMRVLGVFFIVFLLQAGILALSQNNTVNIQADHISLEQLFAEIEKQTELKFLYRYENISGKVVHSDFTNQTVAAVLDEALKINGLQYTMMENNLIVIAPDEMAAKQRVTQPMRSVSGCITDAEDGSPIPAVAVFFDNTTVGTTTDLDGNYRLNIPGEGSYRLTVQHVGYQTVFSDIEPNITSTVFDVTLQSIELEEFTVATKVKFRQTDINLFWRTILGKNPSKKTIQATNPEVVYYYYNPETKLLKVTCREPLQIVNYETGYQIHYVLNNFTHDYNTGFTDWRNQSVFTELEPQNPKQKVNWEKNRKDVYDISLTKFIKSLYNNTLTNDGFVLADFNFSLVDRDEILQSNPFNNSKTIDIDGLLLLICYGKPITHRDLERLQTLLQASQETTTTIVPQESMPASSSQLEQIYERRRALTEKENAFRQSQKMENLIAGLYNQGKIMNTLQGDSIRIFPDGTFTNTLSMGQVNNSGSLMGLSMRLPVEYLPDGTMPLAIVNDLTEDEDYFDNIVQNFEQQLNIFPQEKIHLHTDRDYYVPGERIRFRAYVTDAATHQHSTQSRYVYVELISPVDTLVSRVMIRPENDMYYGHLFLSEIIPEGNYTLRAYTRYMENQGDDYFFKKNIRIGTLSSTQSQMSPTSQLSPTSQRNIPISPPKDDYDVSFFPEGGNLVEGMLNKVALKVLNRNGSSEMITGTIVNEDGVAIASVQTLHAGMGVFAYIPERGKRCFLQCQNGNGLKKQFELPVSNPRANALTVSQNNNRISVGIRKSVDSPDNPFYLLAQCRGEVFYFSEWDQKNEMISFAEEGFPAGVIQFVLFDKQMNPLSERLVFSKNYDKEMTQVAFQTNKTSYEKREKVIATLTPVSSSSSSGRVGEGLLLSVAITDDADIAIDSTTTILSSLLLSSELKGYIENPAWYLQDNNQSTTALDYLMMTHGWRRYNVPEVVKGKPEVPQIPFQTNQEISGQVRGLLSRPETGSEVIIVAEEGGYGITTTDEKGTFRFQDFEYPDSTSFMIQALNKRGSDRVEIVLNKESSPTPVHAPQSTHLIPTLSKEEGETKSETETNAFIVKAEQRASYDEDMRIIHLGDIVVTAPRIDRTKERRLDYWANKSSDYTIRREEIEKMNYSHVAQYLTFVPGVLVFPNPEAINEYFVQIGSPLLPPPVIVVDGIQIENINEISPNEVESIDVLKYASSTGFGVRGAGGVISITTIGGEKGSEIEKFNQIVYTPTGYQKPVEFYSPKYETLEAKYLTIPDLRTTIFWKPDVVIAEDEEETSFEFYTSDFPTTYSVVIEGLTTDGKIVRQVETIKVE